LLAADCSGINDCLNAAKGRFECPACTWGSCDSPLGSVRRISLAVPHTVLHKAVPFTPAPAREIGSPTSAKQANAVFCPTAEES